jgi:hypothetical protein
MESAARRFARLLGALEDLVGQEDATLRAGDFAAAGEVQRRAEPIVSGLGELGPGHADGPARARIAALLARRQHSMEWLESQLAAARAELAAVQHSQARVARIAPAYFGAPRGVVSRLNATG